ncbi:hypothetical protein AB4084_27300, partial [Lysobacter sp. 2RAB21]
RFALPSWAARMRLARSFVAVASQPWTRRAERPDLRVALSAFPGVQRFSRCEVRNLRQGRKTKAHKPCFSLWPDRNSNKAF